MKKLLTLTILTLLTIKGTTQNLDSLWGIWKDNKQADTTRLKAIYDFTWYGYVFSQPDSAFYYGEMMYNYSNKKGLKKQMADALHLKGISFDIQGDYNKAVDYYTSSLKIREEIGDKKGMGASLNNIGVIYYGLGDYAKAIDYYTKSLKIREEIGDKKGIASSLNNIGAIYTKQGDFAKAVDYSTRGLKLKEEIGDKKGIAFSLNDIGAIYLKQGNNTKAIDYFTRSLKIREEIGDKQGVAQSLNNLGAIYENLGDHVKAIDHHSRSLKIQEEVGNKKGIAASLINIGDMFYKQNNFSKAIDFCTRALELAQETAGTDEAQTAAEILWKIYKKTGKPQQALQMHELYILMRDSLESEQNQKEVIRQEYKYAYEKKEAVAIAEQEKKDVLAKEELEKQTMQRNGFIGGFILMLALAGVVFRSYRNKQKANLIITQQKHEVEKQKRIIEEKHKEITDSINYARKIQQSILPNENFLTRELKRLKRDV